MYANIHLCMMQMYLLTGSAAGWNCLLYSSWQLLKMYSYVELRHAFTQSLTTWAARGGDCSSRTWTQGAPKKTRIHLYKNNVTPANKSIVTHLRYESLHKSLSLTAQRNQSSSQTFYYPLVLYELRQTEMTERLLK